MVNWKRTMMSGGGGSLPFFLTEFSDSTKASTRQPVYVSFLQDTDGTIYVGGSRQRANNNTQNRRNASMLKLNADGSLADESTIYNTSYSTGSANGAGLTRIRDGGDGYFYATFGTSATGWINSYNAISIAKIDKSDLSFDLISVLDDSINVQDCYAFVVDGTRYYKAHYSARGGTYGNCLVSSQDITNFNTKDGNYIRLFNNVSQGWSLDDVGDGTSLILSHGSSGSNGAFCIINKSNCEYSKYYIPYGWSSISSPLCEPGVYDGASDTFYTVGKGRPSAYGYDQGFINSWDTTTDPWTCNWNRCVGRPSPGAYDNTYFEAVTTDGSQIIAAGRSLDYSVSTSQYNLIICSFDTSGNLNWCNEFEFNSGESYTTRTIELDGNGNLIIAASTVALTGYKGTFVARLPADGSGTGTYSTFTYRSISPTVTTITGGNLSSASGVYYANSSINLYQTTSTTIADDGDNVSASVTTI